MIQKLVQGGAGMGEVDGKKILVPLSAPGDELEVEVVADHGRWAEAEISRIIQPAQCRVTPLCPFFGSCGGCQWQHLNYRSQLEWKRAILRETLERVGKISDPRVLETLPSPNEWHYRNRIQLHVDSQGRVGFYRRRSKDVVAFDSCAIADVRLNEELARRREEFSQRDRGVALRLEEQEGSFSQINSAQNEQLRRTAVEWLSALPHRSVLELYAGAGNFTFAIARTAGSVLGVEVDARAVEAAKRRQVQENVCNVEFVCAPADKGAARAAKRLGGGCDAVLLDPPRKGCVEAIDAIVRLRPASLLYISCDPATLARDVQAFIAHGYRLEKSIPVDMFPQTFHIESLTLLTLSISPI